MDNYHDSKTVQEISKFLRIPMSDYEYALFILDYKDI